MQTKLIKFVLYPLFFLLCLVFFLVRGFPIEQVSQGMIHRAETLLGMKITTGGLSTLFPNGVEAVDVRLQKPGEKDGPPLTLTVERVSARIGLLALLTGDKDVSFASELLTGKIEGEVNVGADTVKLSARSYAVDLEKLPVWKDLLGINLGGKLNATIELDMSKKDIKETKGHVDLNLEAGKVGNGPIQVSGFGPLTLPWISLGKTDVVLEVAKGKADIKSFKVASDDIDGTVDGYFLLQQKLDQISARCKTRFKISDDFFKRNPKFEILTQKLAPAKGKDGYYGYTIFGPVIHPQFKELKQ
jgi:type II secretion system protein N